MKTTIEKMTEIKSFLSALTKYTGAYIDPWHVYNDGDHVDSFETLEEAVAFMVENMTCVNKDWNITFEYEHIYDDNIYIDIEWEDYKHLI